MKEANFRNKIAEYQSNGGKIKKTKEYSFKCDEWRYCPTYANNPLGWNPGRGAE